MFASSYEIATIQIYEIIIKNGTNRNKTEYGKDENFQA